MKKFLERIKCIDYLTTELEIQKADFISNFSKQVEKGDIGMFSGTFEVFSSSDKRYKGNVDHNGLRIRPKRNMFDVNLGQGVAEGKFTQKGDVLAIETTINGANGKMKFYFAFVLFFYVMFTGAIFGFASFRENVPLFVIPFILFHALFMLGLPIIIMRKSVKNMKYNLEREYFYATKKY